MAVQEELVEEQRRVHRAEDQIDELENELLCTICMGNKRLFMYQPCNHFYAYGQCPITANATHCLSGGCGAAIEAKVKLFT